MAAASWVMASPSRWAAAQGASRPRPRARARRPHPPAAAAAVGLDRRAGRAGTAAPDLPRVVAEGTRGPAVTGPAARDEVLARIRTALGSPAPGGQASPPADPVPRGYRTSGDLGIRAAARPAGRAAARLRLPRSGAPRPARLMTAVARSAGQRGARRVVVPPGLDLAGLPGGCRDRRRRRPLPRGARRRGRRHHRRRGRDRRDRHHRPRRIARARAAARCPWSPTTTCAWCAPARSSRLVPEALARLDPRAARSPGSAARPPPATSSWTGSRACTAPAPSRSSSSSLSQVTRADHRATRQGLARYQGEYIITA